MTFNDALNKAARELPEGWEIRVHVQNGYGEIVMFQINSEQVVDFTKNFHEVQTIKERFLDALEMAKMTGKV